MLLVFQIQTGVNKTVDSCETIQQAATKISHDFLFTDSKYTPKLEKKLKAAKIRTSQRKKCLRSKKYLHISYKNIIFANLNARRRI